VALITVSELEAQSGEVFDDDDWVLAETLLPYVEAEIEAYLGRSIEQRLHTDEPHQLNWATDVLYLQHTPVVSISTLSVNGYAISADFFAPANWGVTLFSYGVSFNAPINSPLWLSPTLDYLVTYTGGLDGANLPVLKSVIARTALREMSQAKEGWDARAGYTSVKVEDYSFKKDASILTGAVRGLRSQPAGLIHPRDQILLDRWKKKTVIS